MKKFLVLVFVLMISSQNILPAQVNGDNDTIWTKQNAPEFTTIEFSPDQTKIIAQMYDPNYLYRNIIQFYDINNGGFIKQLDSAWSLMIDSARNRVYTTFLKKIYAWDIDTYEKFDYFVPGEKDLQQPTYSARNNRIAALMGNLDGAKNEGVVKIWDCVTGKVVLTKTYGYFNNPETGHSFPPGIIEIKFNDGLNILSIFVQYGDYRNENDPWGSVYISKEIREVYDATTFDYKSDNPFLSNHFYMSESGKYVVIFARQQDGKDDMLVIRTSDFSEAARIPVYKREDVYDIIISNDDKYLIYCNGNITRVYDIDALHEIYTYKGAITFDLSNDNSKIVTSGGNITRLYRTPWYTSVPYENDINAVISFPNPVENIINLEFTLTKPGSTKIELFDNSGRSVNNLYDGYLNEGNHHYTYDLRFIPVGSYLLVIKSGTSAFSQKIIINK